MLKNIIGGTFVAAVLLVQAASAQGDQSALAQLHAIEPYHIDKEVKGNAHVIGSGSVLALTTVMTENFKQFHPGFQIEQTGGGSEYGLKTLPTTAGGLAAITRPIEAEDIKAMTSAGMKKPVAILVGLDALAVFVHKENPIQNISPTELHKIFSDASVKTWGQVGLTGEWANRKITVFERGSESGTQTFIERYLLQNGTFRADAVVYKTNADMVVGIKEDKGAITVAPLYLKTDIAKPLPVQLGQQLIEPNETSILRGVYPLVRPLMMVFDMEGPPASVELNRQFLKFALSREGQLDVVKSGYYPLNQGLVRQQQDALGIEIIR